MQKLRGALRWNRASYVVLSGFLATVGLIVVVWWPLAEDVLAYIDPTRPLLPQLDWLLIGIFLVMSLLIMLGADLRTDGFIVLVGLVAGLAIEGWGTQTGLWAYYTLEHPPLWIIPAWPIANLSFERIARVLNAFTARLPERWFVGLYWGIFAIFYPLLLVFVRPTFGHILTQLALVICALLIVSCRQQPRPAMLIFTAGIGLGYFLELWGTTRLCWTYYTPQEPPIFAVLAHGMAAVAVWRAVDLLKLVTGYSNLEAGSSNQLPATSI